MPDKYDSIKDRIEVRTQELAKASTSQAVPNMPFYRQHATVQVLVDYIDEQFSALQQELHKCIAGVKLNGTGPRNDDNQKEIKPARDKAAKSSTRAAI